MKEVDNKGGMNMAGPGIVDCVRKGVAELLLRVWLTAQYLQLQHKVNEVDNKGDIPLDLALRTVQKGIAETLLKNHADVNRKDNAGKCLLHKAIKRGGAFIEHT